MEESGEIGALWRTHTWRTILEVNFFSLSSDPTPCFSMLGFILLLPHVSPFSLARFACGLDSLVVTLTCFFLCVGIPTPLSCLRYCCLPLFSL